MRCCVALTHCSSHGHRQTALRRPRHWRGGGAAADLLLQLRPVVNFAYESKASDLSRSENCFHVAEVLVFSRNNSSTKIFAARQNFGGSLIVT
jgi:hypothetical protein